MYLFSIYITPPNHYVCSSSCVKVKKENVFLTLCRVRSLEGFCPLCFCFPSFHCSYGSCRGFQSAKFTELFQRPDRLNRSRISPSFTSSVGLLLSSHFSSLHFSWLVSLQRLVTFDLFMRCILLFGTLHFLSPFWILLTNSYVNKLSMCVGEFCSRAVWCDVCPGLLLKLIFTLGSSRNEGMNNLQDGDMQ